jgi:hypothetical protein
MDSSNVIMWALNNITTIEDENIITHLNNTNTILTWNTKELLVVLVQMQTSRIITLRLLKNWRPSDF